MDELLDEEFAKLPRFDEDRFDDAREIFREVALQEDFPAFLTLPAYARYLREGLDRKACRPLELVPAVV